MDGVGGYGKLGFSPVLTLTAYPTIVKVSLRAVPFEVTSSEHAFLIVHAWMYVGGPAGAQYWLCTLVHCAC